MVRRIHSLEHCINAIIDRDKGLPYSVVLEKHSITPDGFSKAVNIRIDKLIGGASNGERDILINIKSNAKRKSELFRMEEDFLQQQYHNMQSGTQKRFFYGTLSNPENIQNIVYTALTFHHPKLSSNNRKLVIEAIKKLPPGLNEYFKRIRLNTIGQVKSDKGKMESSLATLELFDSAYQKKTGDKSLFDLTQEYHLHKWGDNFNSPHFYFRKPENVEQAIYHTLTEKHPHLGSVTDRGRVIAAITNLPSNLTIYFRSIGLLRIMRGGYSGIKRDSPLAILEIFDKEYQKRTGDKSLFDLTQESHLHRWGINFNPPLNYWKNRDNVQESVYHTLTENHPELASPERSEVVGCIKKLPKLLKEYFYEIQLTGAMRSIFANGKSDCPQAVLMAFDQEYQKRTGDKSLFDKTQSTYLEFNHRNRLMR